MYKLNFVLLSLLFSLFFGFNIYAQNYETDTQKSILKWTGEKILGKHWGTVKIKNGTISNNNNKMTGSFEIDMTTIVADDLKKDKSTHDKLVGHLKSDDFFSVDKFSTSTFIIKKMDKYNPKKGENYNYMITGDLTIKGITHEIRFPAKIDINNNELKAKAEFTIDRTKWNIRYGSGTFFDNLGDKAIYDDIKFELNLIAKAK